MKKLLTCAGLLVALGLTAQTPKIELGIELSTENIEGSGLLKDAGTNFYDRIVRDRSNFSMGITANLLSNSSSFSFRSGLLYAQKDITSFKECGFCHTLFNALIVPEYRRVEQRYLSVPFLIRYEPKQSRLSPIAEVGLYNHFLVNDGQLNQNRSAYMEASFALGASYKLNNTLRAELKYNYRASLSTVYSGEVVRYHYSDSEPNRLRTNAFQLGFLYSL
ncbi:outer membrane beta-barrel protein [Roseivirga sp. UBA1976]|uniref:outer membrane beta-barrel protein n=1 Tax=Roseivirga sp. UBA1976 TaxID=1947386 RepID=UPI00257B72BB|nr:outer membrane beta-barrel protein [Roseivirga sp. UBA1976]|tara:strand:+ start:418 stop:1077 length:660 start_codon:yes stop_codon:yes gene_type:complete